MLISRGDLELASGKLVISGGTEYQRAAAKPNRALIASEFLTRIESWWSTV